MTDKDVFVLAQEVGLSVAPEDRHLMEFLLVLDAETEGLGTERLQGGTLEQRKQCAAAMTAGDIARSGIEAYRNGNVLEAYRCLARALPHYAASFSGKAHAKRNTVLTSALPSKGRTKNIDDPRKREEAINLAEKVAKLQEAAELSDTSAVNQILGPDLDEAGIKSARRQLNLGRSLLNGQ